METLSGIVFDIQRYSLKNGPGIRTTVFLKGCPLRCWWCSNPESQDFAPELMFDEKLCTGCGACAQACPEGLSLRGFLHRGRCTLCLRCAAACLSGALTVSGRRMTVQEALAPVLKDRAYYRRSGGGMTLSGGECLSQPAFAIALLRAAKAEGIHTVVDTSLYAPWPVLREAAAWTDLFLADIKQMDPEKHRDGTGVDNGLILSNLAALLDSGARVWLRLPVIRGVSDDLTHCEALAAFLGEHPLPEKVDILPGHGIGLGKYAQLGRGTCAPLAPEAQTLQAMQAILEKSGAPAYIETI